jgi:hypothetical protein
VSDSPPGPIQLSLDFDASPKPEPKPSRPKLRVIQGGGARVHEPLESRDAVARVLMEAGADLLLHRISSARAEEIERQVNAILDLFDRVDRDPKRMHELQARLDELESLMSETRAVRSRAVRRSP